MLLLLLLSVAICLFSCILFHNSLLLPLTFLFNLYAFPFSFTVVVAVVVEVVVVAAAFYNT